MLLPPLMRDTTQRQQGRAIARRQGPDARPTRCSRTAASPDRR
jgi:hypothetical protein